MRALLAGVAAGLVAVTLSAFNGSVVSAAGDPISGATVTAYRCETEEAQLDRIVANGKRTPLAKTTSNAKGAFTVDVAGHGLIVVGVEAPGFAPNFTTHDVDEEAAPIVLQHAEFREGSIRSPDGPIAGARVIVIADNGETEARSDERGRFRMNALDAVRKVLVVHPKYAPAVVEQPSSGGFLLVRGSTVTGKVQPARVARIRIDGLLRGVSAADGTFSIGNVDPSARTISAETDDTFGVSTVKPQVTIATRRRLTLRGVVRDTAGRPLGGIVVIANALEIGDSTAVTDEKGQYALRHLAPGGWTVYVTSAEWTAEEVDLELKENTIRDLTVARPPMLSGTVKLKDGTPLFGAAITMILQGVDVQPGVATTDASGRFRVRTPDVTASAVISAVRRGLAPARVKIELEQGARRPEIALTIPKGIEVTGRVVDAAGAPVGDVAIAPAEMSGAIANTRSDGTFAVPLPEGDWGLEFSKEGFLEQAVHNIRVGAARAPLQVTLQPAYAIRGRIVRKDGTPAGAVRLMFDSNGDTSFAVSGGDGRFELKNLRKGPGILRYQTERTKEQSIGLKAPADDVAIVLPETGSIRGRVVDAAGAPVDGFSVDGEQFSDTDGTFELRDAAVGAIDLTVEARGFLPSKKTIAVGASQIADAGTIVLSRGRTIRGIVTSAAGAPLAGALVNLRSNGTPTAEDGRYELGGVALTETLLSYGKEGFVPIQRTLPAGEEDETVDVQLAPGVAVTGHVVRADGSPARARVYASSAAHNAASENEEADTSGAFHFGSLVPGRYDFTAAEPATDLTGMVADVDVANVHDVTIHLEPPTKATISGSIAGVDLSTTPPATIIARALDNNHAASAQTDAAGNYSLTDVPRGFVTIYAIAGHRSSRPVIVEVTTNAHLHVDLAFTPEVEVNGRVTRGGRPFAAQAVFFMRADDQSGSANAVTDDGGTFTMSLAEGPYRVTVGGTEVERDVRAGSPIEIALDVVKVSVTVLDAETAGPVAGASVSTLETASPTHTTDRGQTDSAGQVAFETARTPARIVVEMSGYATANVDGQTPAIVKLTRTDGALVRLVDARDGTTLAGYAIVRDAAGHVLASASEPRADGSVRLAVAPGRYRFSASAPGYGSQTVVAEVPSAEVRIPLRRGGKLLLVSQNDVRANARLIQPDGEEYVRCWCNGVAETRLTGRVTLIESVAPGAYTLEVTPDGGKPRAFPVNVIEGQTVTVALP